MAEFLKKAYGRGMYPSVGMTACTECREAPLAVLIQDGFGEDASGGITRAKKKDLIWACIHVVLGQSTANVNQQTASRVSDSLRS